MSNKTFRPSFAAATRRSAWGSSVLSLMSFCFSSTKETNTKDEIVVEMKTDTKTEESVLLKAVNGDKKDTGQQMTVVSMASLFHT